MNSDAKHVILGAGGAIGNTLLNELSSKGKKVKLVSRSGKGRQGFESMKANLTNREDTSNAVEDSSIVYLVAGLPYDYSVWKSQWFKIMHNTVYACEEKNARLIFFDNVYAYGKVEGPMTESTPYSPCSRKGELRAMLDEYLENEIKQKNITAMIVRAADFYGPYSEKGSIPFILAVQNLAKGKKAQWLADIKTKHSYTYTIDCGKAISILSDTDSAFNQVWHMPTAKPPLSGEEFIDLVAKSLDVKPSVFLLKKWMVGLTGIFNKQIKELYEMLYQNEFDYIFDSSKFEENFNFKPTPYETGIQETIKYARKSGII